MQYLLIKGTVDNALTAAQEHAVLLIEPREYTHESHTNCSAYATDEQLSAIVKWYAKDTLRPSNAVTAYPAGTLLYYSEVSR